MKGNVLEALAAAPAQLNIMPRFSVDTVCEYINVVHEERFPVLEILGRPMDDALKILAGVCERPERSKVFMAIGTVLTRSQAEQVVALKPDLVVSAAFSRRVLDVTVDAGIDYVPAVSSLQDIQDILDAYEDVGREVKVLKVCPVMLANIEMVSIFSAIFPGIKFCPTGTIELEDIATWKAMHWMGAPMERWFVPDSLIESHDWDAVRTKLRQIRVQAAAGVSSQNP